MFYFDLFDLFVWPPIFCIGAGLLAVYKLCFVIPEGFVAIVPSKKRKYTEGRHWGIPPKNVTLISLVSKPLAIPKDPMEWIQIETPDDGVLGAKVVISYAPNEVDARSLINFSNSSDLEMALDSRVRSALTDWMWQRPKPGTLKRAMASKLDAEQAVMSKLAFLHTDTLALFGGIAHDHHYASDDLGVIVREVHLVDMSDLKKGTGKPSWGDDDELLFNAEKVRMRFRQTVNNVSDLRLEKAKLIEDFPEEEAYIENLYDEERIRSMEHHDR
jgi:hypothetical protein